MCSSSRDIFGAFPFLFTNPKIGHGIAHWIIRKCLSTTIIFICFLGYFFLSVLPLILSLSLSLSLTYSVYGVFVAHSSVRIDQKQQQNISIASIDYRFFCVRLLCTESLWFFFRFRSFYFVFCFILTGRNISIAFVSAWLLLVVVYFGCYFGFWTVHFPQNMLYPCHLLLHATGILPVSQQQLHRFGMQSTHTYTRIFGTCGGNIMLLVHKSRCKTFSWCHWTKRKPKIMGHWYCEDWHAYDLCLGLKRKLKGTNFIVPREILIEYDGNANTKYD